MGNNLNRRTKPIIVVVSVISVALLIAIFSFYYVQNISVETQITELYREILNRDPDHVGLSYYREQITRNEKSIEWVEEQIRSSPEAVAVRVAELYREILNREPDPEGMNYYTHEIMNSGKSFGWVEEMLQNSDEARSIAEMKTLDELRDETKKIIDELYIEILHRPVDTKGLEYFGSMLENGKMTVDDIRNAILESDEYKAMN